MSARGQKVEAVKDVGRALKSVPPILNADLLFSFSFIHQVASQITSTASRMRVNPNKEQTGENNEITGNYEMGDMDFRSALPVDKLILEELLKKAKELANNPTELDEILVEASLRPYNTFYDMVRRVRLDPWLVLISLFSIILDEQFHESPFMVFWCVFFSKADMTTQLGYSKSHHIITSHHFTTHDFT